MEDRKNYYLLNETLSIGKNQKISLHRAMIESLLAIIASCWEVVTQTKWLLGHFRSHESIRWEVVKEAKGLIKAKKGRKIWNLTYSEKKALDTTYIT